MSTPSETNAEIECETPLVPEMTAEEERDLLEWSAQHYLHMSAEEFLCKWKNHEFPADIDATPGLVAVAMLLPEDLWSMP